MSLPDISSSLYSPIRLRVPITINYNHLPCPSPHPSTSSFYGINISFSSLRSLTTSALPPTAPLLTYILTPSHPLLTPLLHLSTTTLLSHLSTTYAQLVKDRLFLSAEVMREYDQRFVYRKVFASRVDRGTQTNEGESELLGP